MSPPMWRPTSTGWAGRPGPQGGHHRHPVRGVAGEEFPEDVEEAGAAQVPVRAEQSLEAVRDQQQREKSEGAHGQD